MTFVQRFGSAAANPNVHFHSLVLDGVYEVSDAGPTRFHPLPPPDEEEVARMVVATALRLGNRVEPEELTSSEDTPRPRCASAAGLSLRADVAVPARDRKRLERLARYASSNVIRLLNEVIERNAPPTHSDILGSPLNCG